MKKLEDEKLELITGVNEVTAEAQSENDKVLKKFEEIRMSKKALENRVTELENLLLDKNELIENIALEMQRLQGMTFFFKI